MNELQGLGYHSYFGVYLPGSEINNSILVDPEKGLTTEYELFLTTIRSRHLKFIKSQINWVF